LLNFVRGDPGKAGVASMMRRLERLEVIRAIGLPAGLFAGTLPHEVELFRRRVAVQPPSDLRRLPQHGISGEPPHGPRGAPIS